MTHAAAGGGRYGAAFDLLEVERAWQRTRGSSAVVVGIVDQGVQLDHHLLGPNIQRDHSHHTTSSADHEIRGTHVAGVAAGRCSDQESFSGVAPEARILPVRFSQGSGAQALDLANAIEYAVERGAHIVNLGARLEPGQNAVYRAIQYAATRNVLVVCPAFAAPELRGPHAGITPPNLLTVLAIDEHMAPLVHGNLQADLTAPGFARVPRWRAAGFSQVENPALGAPYVSGCAALVKSMNPSWGYHELREHLLESSGRRTRLLNVAHAVLGPLELTGGPEPLTWSPMNDAELTWKLRYRSDYCIHAVALYRPKGDEHWRELGSAPASSQRMLVPATSLRRGAGTLCLASREANFYSETLAVTIR